MKNNISLPSLLLNIVILVGVRGQTNSPSSNEQISPTLTRKLIEQKKYKLANKAGVQLFSFQMKKQSEQFFLHLSKDIEILMNARIYIKKDVFYQHIEDISKEPPILMYVYQNNNRMIANQSFYFYGTIRFRGKADSNYMIRFFSTSTMRMINVEHTKVLDKSIFENKLQSTSTNQHNLKLQSLLQKIYSVVRPLRQNHLAYDNNKRQLKNKIKILINYHVFETIFLVIASFFQIKLISSLLKSKQNYMMFLVFIILVVKRLIVMDQRQEFWYNMNIQSDIIVLYQDFLWEYLTSIGNILRKLINLYASPLFFHGLYLPYCEKLSPLRLKI